MRVFNSKAFSLLIVFLLCFGFVVMLQNTINVWHWHKILEYKIFLLHGILTTIEISFVAFIFSLLLGMILYISKKSSLLVVKDITKLFTSLVQGTPLIVYVLVGYYIVVHSLGVSNRFFSGALILGTFYSVPIAQIIEGGINSIGEFQWLTAKSLGFTKFLTYRYIIIPQLWKMILPTLTYQTASLIKDSSLLSIIALQEFYQATTESSNQSYATLEFYLAMAVGYLALTIPLQFLSNFLKKKYYHET